jgi:hypothetical protein
MRPSSWIFTLIPLLVSTAALAQATSGERCAARLSLALTGKSPTAALLTDPLPQSKVDAMIATPEFNERFARFINKTFNPEAGATPAEDATYYLAKYVLANNRQWREMFVGLYQVTPGPAATNGFKGEYYDNIDFTNLVLTRTDATINFDFAAGSPAAVLGVDTFSVRWTGKIQPRFNETYTFRLTSDDGVRLYVNNQLIINNFTDHAAIEDVGTLALNAGQVYDLRLEYYENAGGAVAKLEWQSGSQVREFIRTAPSDAVVVADANGLGYFRSPVWMRRYAGNELEGYRLTAAYRIMNNITGLKLLAAQNTDGINATGRLAPPCNSCHYEPVFGLDYAARVLSRRSGTGETMTFIAPNQGPQTFLGGQVISDDKQFVTALVSSPDFTFRACRLAVDFLYARSEYQCEGPTFDRCVAAFKASGTIQSAVSAVARDATFCQ